MLDDAAAARLQQAFSMFEFGVATMRLNLRRRHPDASDAEIDQRLAQWLHTRPGAEQGDAAGIPRAWKHQKT